jgi:hypothetical protein
MLLYALNPLPVTIGTLSTPALLEVGHDIGHFQELSQGHTENENKLSMAHEREVT